jgi:hypothetical protein
MTSYTNARPGTGLLVVDLDLGLAWDNNSKAWRRIASSIARRMLRFRPKWSTG